ncbi:MAG TPA: ATP-binding protein, partial [Albitalea sp.]
MLVTAVPLLLFTAGLVVWHSETEKRLLQQQAARMADTAMQAVDRELAGMIRSLQVLAASPALATGALEAFHAQASSAVGIAGSSGIVLYDRTGRRLVSTAVPYGKPVPPRADMSPIAAPFETRRPHVSRLQVSETTQQPMVGVVVPVRVGSDVPYVLAAGLASQRLTAVLGGSGLPRDWIGTLLDAEGTIVARTRDPERSIGRKGRPENRARIDASDGTSGMFEGRSQEGDAVLLAFAKSDTSGLATVIGVPSATLRHDLRSSLGLVAATGGAVLLLALLMAWRAAKTIYWPTEQLEAAARSLEEGEAVHVPATGIEQFDHLGRAMADAGHRIQQREASLSSSIAELRQAHATLREEQAKKDEFIATLAHELRNPLAPIRTGFHLLRKAPTGPVAERTLALMDRQLTHMVRLIDDLLDVSRIARGKIALQKEDVVLQVLVAQVAEGCEPLFATGGQRFELDMPEAPIWVHVDATRLSQVVTNLLNNAAKFTLAGGSVRLAVQREDAQAVIRVADTGIGIPPERLGEVFGMFTQIRDGQLAAQPGLGIGLSIAKMLVEMHGGTIEAHSAGRGAGATFAVRLPVTRPGALKPPASPAQAPGSELRRRVMVVDDNADAAEVLAAALRESGHEAWVAHDGFQALDLAAGRDADLVLLDIGMPGMDGYQVCRRLRDLPAYRRTKIVALTG